MPRIDVEKVKIDPDDNYLLEILFQESSRSISNNSRKQGALIVKGGSIISSGHFEAYKNKSSAKEKEEVEVGSGAIENAIATCAKFGISVNGATLYTYVFPNAIACKLLVKAGISEIRFVRMSDNPLGLALCKESKIQLTQIRKVQ